VDSSENLHLNPHQVGSYTSHELLGSLPLDLSIRANVDRGQPSVATDPESSISQKYRAIARKLITNVQLHNDNNQSLPDIEISDD
jgi:ATP-binding protein involved in chromosome partitioning